MTNIINELFGKNVFNDEKMKDRLPEDVYLKLKKTIAEGNELDSSIADVVAAAMKDWAVENGATHYTHWFQPMTGITAEKHDSFINSKDNKAILEFSGKELIKGEPDASSFPSGGIRSTFEARGYTSWDCTSPAFLKETKAGVTLCIPTVFCSYTGEALDKKTPLLRSTEALEKQVLRIVKLFGHKDVKKINCSVGPEQEYFIVSRQNFLAREDLKFTGRTLFGAMPPKGQELEDHYFGSIKENIACFMKEVNEELWKLGVLAKTQHNEAAPAQHELAPIYSEVNIAVDHNQLTMETLKRVARNHGLECLLHEKPFMGVNGSGKHNNWSIITDTGINLLKPGKVPHENLQFLLFLSAVIKAVDENAVLLRVAASNPGNDHRLGAHEAPPAIISIFLGDQLTDIVEQIVESGTATYSKQGGKMQIGVKSLPEIKKDATDRNRTSPFAFTGNKFEFRMVASSISISCANIMLNTIVADVLSDIADELEKADDFQKALSNLIARILKEHKRIIFNGNGYSDEWIKEAERRGLPNVKTFVESIPALTDEKTVKIMQKHHVMSKVELESRAEVQYELYSKTINIEARTMIEMAKRQYIPAVINFNKALADSIISMKNALKDIDVTFIIDKLSKSQNLLNEANNALIKLEENTLNAAKYTGKEQALFFKDNVTPYMEALRKPIDQLEEIVEKKYWPVPTYGDLLFEVGE